MTEKEINRLLQDVYRGKISLDELPVDLFLMTGKKLQQALYQGFGQTLKSKDIEAPAYELLNSLRNNAYRFSGAKTFQNIKDTQALMMDGKGYIRSFSEFLPDARKLYDIYNVNWLETEYKTTISLADSAAKWQQYEADADTLPYLEYQAVMDDNTRPEHASMNGILLPINDSFWDSNIPPNGWNCRCEVLQQRSGKQTTLTPAKREELKNEVEPIFRNNPGTSKVLFKENGKDAHPYFKVDSKHEAAKQRNFGLNIPKP